MEKHGHLIGTLWVLLVEAILMIGLPKPGRPAEQLIFGHILAESTAHHRHMVWAAEEIERMFEGAYTLTVVPRGQIGTTDLQVIEGFKADTAQLAYLSLGHLVEIYPPLSIGAGPFVFRNFDHWKAFRDSSVYEELSGDFESKTGMKVLGLAYYGERHVTTKSPLANADSLKGLAIRTPSIPTIILTFRALGSKPVPIPFKETYQALKEGIVDAQENPLPAIKAMRFYEVTPVINLTAHISDAQLIVMDVKCWQAIPDEGQAKLEKIFLEAANRVTEDVRREEMTLRQSFPNLGVQINSVERKPMQEQLQPFHYKGYFPWDGNLYDRIQELE